MAENRHLGNIVLSNLYPKCYLDTFQRTKNGLLLLSELITLEQYQKLMLDLEIYVDGLSDMHAIIKDIRNAIKAILIMPT